jgi:hypothetical protein
MYINYVHYLIRSTLKKGCLIFRNFLKGLCCLSDLESVEIDVFGGNGNFIYTILPSAEIPELRDVMMFENTIGIIVESEEKNIYVQYRVKNIKGIFD